MTIFCCLLFSRIVRLFCLHMFNMGLDQEVIRENLRWCVDLHSRLVDDSRIHRRFIHAIRLWLDIEAFHESLNSYYPLVVYTKKQMRHIISSEMNRTTMSIVGQIKLFIHQFTFLHLINVKTIQAAKKNLNPHTDISVSPWSLHCLNGTCELWTHALRCAGLL